ncbi:hypothetical protein BRC62_02310 [Halobacteriales archaeon QH_10_67_13]|nr:MAG: hypothetical protein BRC62_02310 [Halobacteriales archaeon QH_10_67_13]
MDLTADEIAGVAGLFGGLTRAELTRALAELAYKRGGTHDPESFEPAVDRAVESYHLVAVEPDELRAEAPVLVPGPVAFPNPPAGADDLPHILDVPERTVDRETAGRAAGERLLAEAAAAVDDGDGDRVAELIDVSYELEAWAGVDVATARDRLAAFEDAR